MTTVLQQLLEAALVEIDDDEQIGKLQAAASSVGKQLSEGKMGIAAATLVAMDPEINPEEPTLDSIYKTVAEHWKTVRTRHPNTPVALLRGILMQALAIAGEADLVAAVIWPTANSFLPYAPLAREDAVWESLLLPIRERAERAGETAWSGRGEKAEVEIPAPEELPTLSVADPTNSVALAAVAKYLESHASQISRAVGGALAPVRAIELRSQILYWREALYSRSQNQSYRTLPGPGAALAMAVDLAKEVPEMCPASVDSLLWEAAYAVFTDQTTTIAEFTAALSSPQCIALAALLGNQAPQTGRKTLLAFVRQAVTSGQVPQDARAQIGVEEGQQIPLADLARWLFRDLRAERIADGIGARPQRRRK